MDPQEAWLQEGQRQARLRSTPAGPTRDIYEQPGVGYFDRSSGRFLGRGSSSGIQGADIGGDGRGEQYRQQLSQYAPKAFPMTAEGQQERYFGTPEMNYVFGAQTGKGPKTAEEMSALASQEKAPTTSSLSDYYRAQSAMGRVNQADIQAMYADRPDLQKWATANPMLAQREFIKQKGGEPTTGPTPFEIMGSMEKGQFYPSEGSPFPMEASNPTGFSGAANAVPAPWNTQGQAVSAPYTEAMGEAFKKTNPMNLVSQQPIEMDNEIGARVQDFLKRRAQWWATMIFLIKEITDSGIF